MSTATTDRSAADVVAEAQVRSKAQTILREGRLRLLKVVTTSNGRVDLVDAVVYGYRGEHVVSYGMSGDMRSWACSCAEGRAGQVCPHVYAAELVTHAIAPPGTARQPKGRPPKRARR